MIKKIKEEPSELDLKPEKLVEKLKVIKTKVVIFFKKIPVYFKKLFTIPKDPHKFRKKLILIIVFGVLFLIIVAIIVFGIGIYNYNWKNRPAQWAQKIIPYPAAAIGSNIILVKDYHQRVEYLEYYYDKIKQTPEESYRKLALEEMIDQKVTLREASKLGIKVTDEEVDEQYQNIVLQEGSEEQVKKLLAELWGFDLNYFKNLIKDTILTEKLKKEIPIAVHLKHILFKIDEGADQPKKDQVTALATKLKSQLEEGHSFTESAKKYSEDVATRDNGGDLNWLTRDQIQIQLGDDCAQKVMNLAVGDLEICRSKQGLDIVQIDERRGKVDETYDKWFNEAKEKTHIWRFIGQK